MTWLPLFSSCSGWCLPGQADSTCLDSGKARSTLSPSRVCVLMKRRLLCCTAYKQSYLVSASDTLISLWRPATETSLVVHVSTSCGTWWPHVSFTLSYIHTYLDTLTWGNGVPQLRSQLDRPQDRRTIWKGREKKKTGTTLNSLVICGVQSVHSLQK